ncbi:MAG: hypothetical protein E6767_04660 [Dysgonomonas sp.]|nr:hypothetical protein [Dysgonomonas sp.]
MNTSKSILLSIFILLPLFVFGQNLYRPVTKREADKIGKTMYITSAGDTTYVSNALSDKLKGKDSEFLFKKADPVIDSIFEELDPNFKTLESGIIETSRLLHEIELTERAKLGNDALSVRLIRKNKEGEAKRKVAENMADSLLYSRKPVEELALDYARFGNQPTYYINGVEVPYDVTTLLRPGEVIERSMKVADTASGNPNGEVWYLVTEKALHRVKIPVNMTEDFMQDRVNPLTKSPSREEQAKQLATYLEEKEKEKTKANLKAQPVVRRTVTADGKTIDKVVTEAPKINKPEVKTKKPEKEQEELSTTPSGTRVLKRTVNSTNTGSEGYIAPMPVSTSSMSEKRSEPVVRQQTQYNNVEEANTKQIEEKKQEDPASKSTPKKSVRRIKKRHKSQN